MDGLYCCDCHGYFPKADADHFGTPAAEYFGCPECGGAVLAVKLCAICEGREALPEATHCHACARLGNVDLDALERAGVAFARRVFAKRREPKTVTVTERELGQLLALSHQLGAMMQTRVPPITRMDPDVSCLLIPQAG